MTADRRRRIALTVVRLLAAALPTRQDRERYLEQWTADVDGAAQFDMSPLGIALGAARTTVTLATTTTEGPAMLPIGPLAIALRRFGGDRQRPARGHRAAVPVLTAVFVLLLLGGVGTLVVR